MRQKKSSGTVIGILLPMGLVCLFAFCSLALALMGGRAYKAIQANVDAGYGSTVAASYLRTKLSQNNQKGQVSLLMEDGVQVLTISATQGETSYLTRIYMDGGELKESYQPASAAFSPGAGVTIAKLRECSFAIDGQSGLFTASLLSEEGTATRVAFALAGGAPA